MNNHTDVFLHDNLDANRSRLIREEWETLNNRSLPESGPLNGLDIHIIDFSGPGSSEELPSDVVIRVEPAMVDKPVDFEERCTWEQARQSFQITRDANNNVWVIGGGPEGAIYGFYTLLKRALGIRWFSPDEEDTVTSSPIEDFPVHTSPSVPLRGFEFSVRKHPRSFILRFLRWMGRNNWNLLDLNAADWAQCPWRDEIIVEAKRLGIRLAAGCHAISYFLPETEFEKNPELFGLRDGKRCLTAPVFSPDVRGGITSTKPIQPCFSNTETQRYLARSITAFLEQHPEIDIFSVWPHDGTNNWCQCPDCLSQSPYEMLYSLTLEIQKHNSEIPFEILCYNNSLNLPRHDLPRNNRTYTLFCPYLRRYDQRMFDPGLDQGKLSLGTGYPEPEPANPSDDREYGVLLNRWLPVMKELDSQLGIFAYYQLVFHDETGETDRSRFLYHPEPSLVESEIRQFCNKKMKVFYDCSPPYPGFWPDGRFYAYLAPLLWEPNVDVQAVIDDYYQATLGDLACDVKKSLNSLASHLKDRNNPGIPSNAAEAARKVFSAVPGRRGKRYLLWLDYILMADKVRQMKLDGRLNKAAELEEKIISFFENHRAELDQHINIEWMQRYSRTAIDYLSHMKCSG